MTKEKPQADKFKEAARELETDNDEKRLDKTLGKFAKPTQENTKKPHKTQPLAL
ncbi:MAG: hypothetical protein JKY83_08120 [Rhizobiaceae bacterium]|nr:hypothetical protein [Rhizobiaceae bacterium]